MKKPKYKVFIENLNKYNSEGLFSEAIRRIKSIETGKVKEEDLERVETEITMLFASIQDRARERGERVKTKEIDHEELER